MGPLAALAHKVQLLSVTSPLNRSTNDLLDIADSWQIVWLVRFARVKGIKHLFGLGVRRQKLGIGGAWIASAAD